MDIRELKEKYKGKLCLIGNIEVDLLCRGEPSEIEQQVKQLIKDVAVGGGFCLGSSNSVPNYTKLENYITMINTAKKYGVYPIKIEE
jgi:uroporphyrinogen decarboxylase